jgi:hypothetical protein
MNSNGFRLAATATYAVWGNVAMLSLPLSIKNDETVPANGNVQNVVTGDWLVGTIAEGKRPRIPANGISSEYFRSHARLDQNGEVYITTMEATGEAHLITAGSNVGILRFVYLLS